MNLRRLLSSLLYLCLTLPIFSEGRLDEFESGFDRSSGSSSNSSSYDEEEDSDWDSWFDEFLMDLLIEGFVESGRASFLIADDREDGDPVLPVLRVDLGYQWVDSDVDAWVTGGEFGYGPFALEGRWTAFREDLGAQSRSLDFSQLHGLYRMSDHPWFELNVGLGAAWLRGEESNRSLSATLPVRFWLDERWGFEFRPAWTEFNDVGLTDLELTCHYRYRHLNVSAGYRWILSEADVQDLSGFRVGLGYRF